MHRSEIKRMWQSRPPFQTKGLAHDCQGWKSLLNQSAAMKLKDFFVDRLRNTVTLFLLEITYRENEIALMEHLQDNKAAFSIFHA